MLSADTKSRIDGARNVLVGKIPNPQAQVEQVTTALIYKFMDDMDERSKALGGKATFFVGEYAKYSWRKIMDPRIGGQERMNLYSEAVQKLSLNAALPQIFRDVFKDAFVPYRDAETLSLFLKEINWFNYYHSEELGNAYEYLLSILGSQGDAGQFRTPRHIIDFIVEILDPKKNETILDPACGTAGFLISAYKHIIKKSDGLDNKTGHPTDKKSKLTPDERVKLLNNFTGYDISPEMVRLSLVNMYLHGFVKPNIEEYDTLTYDDHWNDDFDVIMANPPFMTPKGGMRPHKKFQIQAKRAEVLFVDYITEHLKPNGRAGIIVPEGIVFKSDSAYKALRKMLVGEHGLWAVISLPAGVFQPYSGVKTSILMLETVRARETDEILFIDIKNDGFSLGAQRTPIDKNDLPEAVEVLRGWRENKKIKSELVVRIKKTEIIDSSDHGLIVNRYKENHMIKNNFWEVYELGDVVDILNGSTPSKSESSYWHNGTVPWFTVEDIRSQGRIIRTTNKFITENALSKTSVKLLPKDTVLLCCTASIGEYAITDVAITTNQQFNGLIIKEVFKDKLLPKFLFWLTSSFKKKLQRISGKTSFDFVPVSALKSIKIPVPPIEVQKEIVEELDRYQKIIDGAKQIVDNWRPEIEVDPEWEKYNFNEIASLEYGKSLTKPNRKKGKFPVMGSNGIVGYHDAYLVSGPGIVVGRKGSAGEVVWVDKNFFPIDTTYYIRLKNDRLDMKFMYLQLLGKNLKSLIKGAGSPGINREDIYRQITISLPSLDIQQQIIENIENDLITIEKTEHLIDTFNAKLQNTISKVWK